MVIKEERDDLQIFGYECGVFIYVNDLLLFINLCDFCFSLFIEVSEEFLGVEFFFLLCELSFYIYLGTFVLGNQCIDQYLVFFFSFWYRFLKKFYNEIYKRWRNSKYEV